MVIGQIIFESRDIIEFHDIVDWKNLRFIRVQEAMETVSATLHTHRVSHSGSKATQVIDS